MKTTLYIVRHGTTKWNEEKRMQGMKDIPLSPKGIEEAKRVAEELKKHTVHAIYTSSLSRAYETARAIARYHVVLIHKKDELREGNFGVFEGLTWDELINHELILSRPKNIDRFYDKTGDGESIHELYLRTSREIDAILAKHNKESVVIVSHGMAIKSMFYHLGLVSKEDIEKIQIDNARAYTIEYNHIDRIATPINFTLSYWTDK